MDPSSPQGSCCTASGSTAIRGRDRKSFVFKPRCSGCRSAGAGHRRQWLYGSTALINASLSSDQLTGEAISVDPGLVALAYAGDSTGNGSLSSLDASRVQRVVVGLDTGFEAYDDLNPVLVGDTTGNGGLSSLDASRIQQQVVGLAVDSFPDVPNRQAGWPPPASEQGVVAAAQGHQLGVGALFFHLALVHQHDAVGVEHRVEAVGDEQHGAAAEVLHQVEGNAALGFVVESAGGFVHDQQAGVLQHGAGDGDALALAAAEAAAGSPTKGIAAGQPHDEVVGAGNPGGGDDVIAAGLGVGEGNVVLHRALEEEESWGTMPIWRRKE